MIAEPIMRTSPYHKLLKHKETSIIILTAYNVDMIRRCIESIVKYTRNYELILVGNNPEKEVLDYLNSLKNIDAKIIINAENLGVSYGWNQGIKLAEKDYICFLNDDTVVTPNWLYKLHKCLSLHKDCGLASPTTSYATGPTQCEPSVLNRRFYMSQQDMNDYADSLVEGYNPQTIVGFCMLTTRALIDKVGVFDHKRYIIGNFEETDWQWRIEQLGYRAYWVKGAYVHHYGHSSFQKMDVDFGDLVRKNSKAFCDRRKDKNIYIKNDAVYGEVRKLKKKV